MAPSCWFFRALWLPVMLAVAAAERQVEACSAKKCGNLTISDPFWLADKETGRSCGSPDFEVSCVNGGSILRSSMPFGDGFAIVDISYEEESLHVVDVGKLYTSNSCGVPILNTSAKLSVRFRINPGNMNLILYNCKEKGSAAAVARRDRGMVQTGVRCGNKSEVFARAGVRYDSTGSYSGYALKGCEAIVVPVVGSLSGKMNGSDYEQLIKDGFLLTWVRPPTFALFIAVWWLPLMLVVAEDQQGIDCSAWKCGNVSIFHPFWLTDKATGRSCSSDPYPGFDVACLNNSIPTLPSSIPLDQGFAILNISYKERSFPAIDIGKLDVLDAPDKCRAVFYNTSVKLIPPFKIAPINLNLILYNCTEEDGVAAAARRNRELVQTNVSCGNEWEVLVRAGVPHDATGNYNNYTLDGCDAVVVPVMGSPSGAMNASDYKQLFNDGFLLTWNPPSQHPPLPSKFICQIIF